MKLARHPPLSFRFSISSVVNSVSEGEPCLTVRLVFRPEPEFASLTPVKARLADSDRRVTRPAHGRSYAAHGRWHAAHGQSYGANGRAGAAPGRSFAARGRACDAHGQAWAAHGRSQDAHGRAGAADKGTQSGHGRTKTRRSLAFNDSVAGKPEAYRTVRRRSRRVNRVRRRTL